MALTFVWTLLIIFRFCKYRKNPTHKTVGRVYSIFHKVHEISILYLTISLILGWTYISQGSYKIVGLRSFSIVISCALLLYYFIYHLYMYYDLFQYPCAHIRTRSYLNYATKYGCYLSNLRYEESMA